MTNEHNGTSSSDTPEDPVTIESIIEACKLIPENPLVTLARKYGFDLDKGDKLLVPPGMLPPDMLRYNKGYIQVSQFLPTDNVCFIKAINLIDPLSPPVTKAVRLGYSQLLKRLK